MRTRATFFTALDALALTVLAVVGFAALAQTRPATTAPPSATPIPVTQQPTGSVDPSQQTGTLPGLPGVIDPRGVATGPTPAANTVPSPGYAAPTPLAGGGSALAATGTPNLAAASGASYDVSGLVVAYEPAKSISLRASNGVVRTIGLPANLNVPPDLTNGRYATVRLQRRAKGSPAVLAVSMSQEPILKIKKKS